MRGLRLRTVRQVVDGEAASQLDHASAIRAL